MLAVSNPDISLTVAGVVCAAATVPRRARTTPVNIVEPLVPLKENISSSILIYRLYDPLLENEALDANVIVETAPVDAMLVANVDDPYDLIPNDILVPVGIFALVGNAESNVSVAYTPGLVAVYAVTVLLNPLAVVF